MKNISNVSKLFHVEPDASNDFFGFLQKILTNYHKDINLIVAK